MKFDKETIETIVGIFVIVSLATGAFFYFASAKEVEKLTSELTILKPNILTTTTVVKTLENTVKFVDASQQLHFTSHAVNEIQSRMWKLEERNGSENCYDWSNSDEREEYKKLKLKLDGLKKKEDELIKKTINNNGG